MKADFRRRVWSMGPLASQPRGDIPGPGDHLFFFQRELPEKQFLSISPGAGQISYATGEKAH